MSYFEAIATPIRVLRSLIEAEESLGRDAERAFKRTLDANPKIVRVLDCTRPRQW